MSIEIEHRVCDFIIRHLLMLYGLDKRASCIEVLLAKALKALVRSTTYKEA